MYAISCCLVGEVGVFSELMRMSDSLAQSVLSYEGSILEISPTSPTYDGFMVGMIPFSGFFISN